MARASWQNIPTLVLDDQKRMQKADDWATEQRSIVADQWAAAHEADFLAEAQRIIAPPPSPEPKPSGIPPGPFSAPYEPYNPTFDPQTVEADRARLGVQENPEPSMAPSVADVPQAVTGAISGQLEAANEGYDAQREMFGEQARKVNAGEPVSDEDIGQGLETGLNVAMGVAGGPGPGGANPAKQARQLQHILEGQIASTERELANIQKVRENPRAFQSPGTGMSYAQTWGKLQDLKAKLGQVVEMAGGLSGEAGGGEPKAGLDTILSAWNLSKGLKASMDLSAPFRQGVLLAAPKPKEFFGAFVPMLRAAKSETFAKAVDEEVRAVERPNLYLAPLDTTELGAREEAFMSNLTNKIPGMAASNRAYVTFLNKLRADVYDSVIRDLGAAGRDLSDVEKSGIADVINHFTGRGDLPSGMGDTATALLNGAFFSPRYAISRVQSVGDALGGVRPNASPASAFARDSMAKTVGAGVTILGLAALGGAKVETDPRSSGFGKIQVGPHSYDIWGGEQQIARNVAQLITGQRKTLASGEIAPANRLDTLGRFAQSKLAPMTATAVGLLQGAGKNAPEGTIGTGYGGRPFSLLDLVNPLSDQSLTGPLGLKDLYEGGVAALPGLLGVGYQHLDERPAKQSQPTTITRRPAPTRRAPVRKAS